MARRIVLTVVALIGALLITTVVPLGLLTTARERDAFRQDTALSARALAALAEENLTDHRVTPTLESSLVHAVRRGDQVWVFSAAGRPVAVTGGASAADLPVPPGVLAAVRRTGTPATSDVSDRLWVVVGVRPAGFSAPAGVVVLSRSTGELDERLRVLWAWPPSART
jgi:hypothetical protein